MDDLKNTFFDEFEKVEKNHPKMPVKANLEVAKHLVLENISKILDSLIENYHDNYFKLRYSNREAS
jgi:hypothetical protein